MEAATRSSWKTLPLPAQRDVPPKYGSWNTIYRRFRGWSEAGVWEIVAVTLAEVMATAATTASTAQPFAPTSRPRAEKGDSSTRSWPLAGRFTSKLHCLADALGRPLAFNLTVGEATDCKAYDALIDLPERAPEAFLADKGYDADAIRADLAQRKIKAVIPGR